MYGWRKPDQPPISAVMCGRFQHSDRTWCMLLTESDDLGVDRNAEDANAVHRVEHGLLVDEIYPVSEGS